MMKVNQVFHYHPEKAQGVRTTWQVIITGIETRNETKLVYSI